MRIPSWKGEVACQVPPTRVGGCAGSKEKGQKSEPHPLLLRLHFLLQHLRHVAHGQNHVVHTSLLDKTAQADRGAQPEGTGVRDPPPQCCPSLVLPGPTATPTPGLTAASASTWCSKMGLLQKSTSGFGMLSVSGRRRVP